MGRAQVLEREVPAVSGPIGPLDWILQSSRPTTTIARDSPAQSETVPSLEGTGQWRTKVDSNLITSRRRRRPWCRFNASRATAAAA